MIPSRLRTPSFIVSVTIVASILHEARGFTFTGRYLVNSALRRVFKLSNLQIFSDHKTSLNIPTKMEACKYYNASLVIPEYYRRDFHAYTGGNMDPLSAKEVRAATFAVMDHHYAHLDGYECSEFIRSSFAYLTKRFYSVDHDTSYDALNITDMACGIGVSTSYLEHMYGRTHSNITAIDLSPFFLEVAAHGELASSNTTTFVHGIAESTNIDTDTQDIVSSSYLHHELPLEASVNVLREAHDILRPGGILSILDMNPNLRASNPMLEFVFKRTEPYLDEYRGFFENLTEIAERIGFVDVTIECRYPKTVMIFMRKDSDT